YFHVTGVQTCALPIFLLVRSERHGGLVLGPQGAQIPLDRLDEDPGPLAVFGPGAADVVRRTHSFPHTADIMVNSAYDPAGGEVPIGRASGRAREWGAR